MVKQQEVCDKRKNLIVNNANKELKNVDHNGENVVARKIKNINLSIFENYKN